MDGTTKIGGKFNVGGVLLDRPFKIRRLGHFGYNVYKMDEAMHFYRDLLGFRVTDTLDFARVVPKPGMFDGVPTTVGYFMSHGTDHHSHVIFPKAALDRMGRGSAGGHETNPEVTTLFVKPQSKQVWDERVEEIREASDSGEPDVSG